MRRADESAETAGELLRLLNRSDIRTSRGMGLVKVDVHPNDPARAYGCVGADWAEAIRKAHAHLDSLEAPKPTPAPARVGEYARAERERNIQQRREFGDWA